MAATPTAAVGPEPTAAMLASHWLSLASSAASTAVPGVRTRVTSRRTMVLVALGSSICSQRATR